MLNGFLMLSCIPFSLVYDFNQELHWDFLLCGAITIFSGFLMRLLTRKHKSSEIKKRDGYLIVVGGWLFMTLFGCLPYLISGSIIVGVVLSLPTVGPMLVRALVAQDMFLAGGIILLIGFMTVIGTFVSDILLLIVDPRIRLGDS